ncbi:MAG: glycosyl hydrolase [Pedobacter sp.]|nr:MAG: glycosyl hydrolase [Pedobacter sp.]
MKLKLNLLFILSLLQSTLLFAQQLHKAPAPLFRDPIFDGAADPVMVWNREEKSWWMLYTQRRANLETPGVSYCYGNDIGIASSKDHGQTWAYRGALNLNFEKGKNTFWAPDIVYDRGTYHMFVVYIQGVYTNWGGEAKLVHYTSKNLWDWKFIGYLNTPKSNIIDASLMQMPDGKWRIWYKGPESITMTGESTDLFNWTFSEKPAIGKPDHEGPKAFRFANHYWLLTDEWHGMRVHRSDNANVWERQGLVLDKASNRKEDGPVGAHGDVLVVGEKAYIFYFTHPERTTHGDAPEDSRGNIPYGLRRSSIQVAELVFKNGTLVCDRDAPFDFWLADQK